MRPSLPASVLLLFLVATLPVAASEPYLVEDINPVPQNMGSNPQDFFSLDSGISLFLAEDGGGAGPQLWRSDGSEAGTFRLIDEDYYASSLIVASDRAFFWARDPDFLDPATGLWVTDGSKEGTFPVLTDVSLAGRPFWAESLDLLFFTASEGTHGLELWRTDGTPAGTWVVKDIAPGTAPSSPAHLVEFKGRLFFQANDGVNGPALWSTDGTEAGTRMVRDPWRGRADHTGPEWPRVAGARLYFFAPGPGIGEELWVSDGTTRGTRPVVDLVPGPGSPQLGDSTALGNRLLVILNTGRGQELWVSDGTRAGTRPLTNFKPLEAFGQFPFLSKQPFGKLLPFQAHDGAHGFELWVTDGTPAGTRLVKDICPGQCSSNVGFTIFGNRLVLSADDGKRGHELWGSDGTPAGTRLVKDICPGACSSFPGQIAVLGNRLLFSATSDATPAAASRQLWRTDGTSRGTVRISSFERGYHHGRVGLVPGAILFTAWDSEHGEELWRSNGTRQETRLVEDINSQDVGGSFPRAFRSAANELLFVADAPDAATGEVRAGLWWSDGTPLGTRPAAFPPECSRVPDLRAVLPAGGFVFACQETEGISLWSWTGTRITPPGVWITGEVVVAGESVFFAARDAEGDYELWTSDGGAEAHRVADVPGISSDPSDLMVLNGRVLFAAWSVESSGIELWSSDGTEAGTVALTQHDARPDLLGLHAGRLWFAADSPETGYELWSTDGTAAGTRPMGDMVPNGSWSPVRLVSAGDKMFLSAGTYPDNGGLWVSDGTVAGTHRVGPYPLQHGFRFGPDAAVVGGRLFYTAYIPGEGAEMLWQSDGTEEGTGPVLGSGLESDGDRFRSPGWLTAFAGRLFFLWNGELWSTDGTPGGASRVPGLRRPEELGAAGGHLFIRAYDPVHGTELWALAP